MTSETNHFNCAGYLQFEVRQGDVDANLESLARTLQAAIERKPHGTGILALPELWATGFAYDELPDLIGRMPAVRAELAGAAAEHDLYLAGSLPEEANGRYYNTLYLTGPTGKTGIYRKHRLFMPMKEDGFFSPGLDKPRPIAAPPGRIACLVCYDLRFPELARRQMAEDVEMLVVTAQWPLDRLDHWRTLIRARAIENQVFVAAANRCGATDETIFAGHSLLVGPDGAILREAGEGEESGWTLLDHQRLVDVRERFTTLPVDR